MPSSFTTPSQDDVAAAAIADFRRRLPTVDVSEGSDAWLRLQVLAGLVAGLHAHLEVVYEDLMPDGCADELLDRWGTVLNLPRKPATPASKSAALRCYGAAGSTVTSGTQLVHADGTLYQVNNTATVPGGGTYVDVDVLAISTGSATRKQAGETLNFVSTPTGFQTSAVLQLDMNVGGEDREGPGDYRPRILNHLSQPPSGGNRNDYVAWALEQAGVDTSFVYPLRQGLGSVDLACLHGGRGSARLLSAGEISTVAAAIDPLRPVSVADFRVLTVTANQQDVEIRITAENDPAYAWDWDDTLAWSVLSWNATTRTLQFAGGTRPADLAVGDRVIVKSSGASGAQGVVESLSGVDSVVLTAASVAAMVAAPSVADSVYSGGPLVDPVRNAILALFDSFGPARGTYASGLWEDTLRTATLYSLSQSTKGVQDTAITTPGSNQTPANVAPNSSIELLTPGRILVRRA